LSNIIKQAIVMSDTRFLDDYIINLLSRGKLSKFEEQKSYKERSLPGKLHLLENQILQDAASMYKTTRQAAKSLGISQPSVVRKFKKHGIKILKNRRG